MYEQHPYLAKPNEISCRSSILLQEINNLSEVEVLSEIRHIQISTDFEKKITQEFVGAGLHACWLLFKAQHQ